MCCRYLPLSFNWLQLVIFNLIVILKGDVPIGTYGFTINILGKGYAVISNPTNITFELEATSISPLSGTTGGGNLLFVNGTGFSSSCTVTVDGIDCPVVNTTYNLITCVAPANVNKIFIIYF